MDDEHPSEESGVKRMEVKFNPRTTKLVSITVSADKPNTLILNKYQGLSKKSEAHMEIEEETTLDAIKEVIEGFRAM